MDEPNAYYPSLLAMGLAAANLALTIRCVYHDFRARDPILLFWLGSLYTAGIPLFIDCLAWLLGYGEAWNYILNSQMENYPYNLSSSLLIRISLFVLAFNALLKLSMNLTERILPLGSPLACRLEDSRSSLYVIHLSIFLGWCGMISLLLSPRGNLIIVTISSLLVTLGSSAVFLAITRKKKVLCVMGAFPSVLTSFVTGERPFVVSAIGCAILGYVYLSPRVLSAKKVSALVLIGLLSVLLLNSVLIGRGPDVGIPDVVHNSLYPVVRDSSTPTLYYCFGESMLMDQGTEFRGIKFLVKTGFFPGTLWGTRDFAEADVPSYLATKWFAWSAGSVHPAIYGWAFVDMKWYGVLFGVYVGFFSSLLVRWARRDWFQRAIVISALSMFFTVGGRGSVQVGYSRTIYVVVVGLLVAKLLIRSPVSANRIDEETGHFALDSR